ncbi:MAG: L,D-transpeptidase [Myxococcales bacterium]|nr:L,D-transpeptidase [Myxococcales bacterium]
MNRAPLALTLTLAVSTARAAAPPTTTAPAAPAAPAAPTPTTPTTLGWPADTTTVSVTRTSHVRAAPDAKAAPLGKIVAGTRVAWTALVAGDRRCPVWVAIAPAGYLCADVLAPTTEPPGGVVQPPLAPGALLPGDYFDVVADDTPAYRDARALERDDPPALLSTHVMVRGRGEVEIGGMDYVQTNKGLVPASELRPLAPSAFVGLDLRAQPAPWPMAFVAPDHPAVVRAAPAADAAVLDQRPARAVVWMKQRAGDWIEIAAGAWVRARELRPVIAAPPPAGLAADAPWIDIDLDHQTLVAYQGGRPVYVTLVSTGRKAGTTPVGVYRVVAKAATTGMAAEADERNQYDVGEVPWALRWKRGLYLHAAYWHDRFGDRKSHGCVNLAPRDARALYEWATPTLPPGWSEVEVPLDQALVVRIRDAAHPDPPWFDYATERPKKARRKR